MKHLARYYCLLRDLLPALTWEQAALHSGISSCTPAQMATTVCTVQKPSDKSWGERPGNKGDKPQE